MKGSVNGVKTSINRRSFVKNGLTAAGAATLSGGLLASSSSAFAQKGPEEHSGSLTRGDAAILRFLAAAEILETDLWQQYNELGGIQDREVPGGSGNSVYTAALAVLDRDMDQYIHDNTQDEFSHEVFINAFLASKGADTVNLDQFRTLPSSRATGAQQIGRLTNLMQLTVDTSWWTQYRSNTKNPDFGDTFDQAVPTLNMGQHPAIPRTDDDLTPNDHIQAIANTAALKLAMMLLVLTFASPIFSQTLALRPLVQADLNVTDGSVTASNGHLFVDAPEMRAISRVPGTGLIEVPFAYLGPTEATSKLADGNVRRQFGLKLNAQDACNVLYVMWRISPKPDLVVSMKHNPGMHSSSQCRDGGYRNLKPEKRAPVPELQAGSSHILRAEIRKQDLQVSVDGELMWEGSIPSEAMPFDGPSGLRSDNVRVQFDMLVGR